MASSFATLGSGADDRIRLEDVGLVPAHCAIEAEGARVFLRPGAGPMALGRRVGRQGGDWVYAQAESVRARTEVRLFDQLCWRDPRGGDRELRLVPGFLQHQLGLNVSLLGSSPDCAVTLDYPQISENHAVVVQAPGGELVVDDLESTNGTFLDRSRVVDRPTSVGPDDVLYLSTFKLPVAQVVARAEPASQSLAIDERPLLVGRDPDADISLDEPTISWEHARLTPLPQRPGWALLEDLGSTNGTFVQGQRIRRQEVGPGTRIQFGRVAEIVLEEGRVRRSYVGDFVLQADSVCLRVSTPDGPLDVLHDVSFTVYPSEFVGLIGPSGAGKTTLLQALNGYLKPTSGLSLVNGEDLHRSYASFQEAIGYVPQDDIIYPELTVAESLRYTARLRLPPDTTDGEIDRRIDEVLAELDLSEARDRKIGSPLDKGISGGQRKRVNLAQELLTKPSLLFLDEPTSGLSAFDTLEVMKLLRRLADEGRTILLTIHQPGLDAYQQMDNVVILGEGRLVYYGPAVPDSMRFIAGHQLDGPAATPVDGNPDEALTALQGCIKDAKARCSRAEWLKQRGPTLEPWQRRYEETAHHAEFVKSRRSPNEEVGRPWQPRPRQPFQGLRQWWTLLQRDLRRKSRSKAYLATVLLQAPIVALLLGLLFGGADATTPASPQTTLTSFALFMLAVTSIWFGASNSAREIVSELTVLRRERMAGLRVLPYLASKLTVMGGLATLQCALLLLFFLPLYEHLDGSVVEHFGVLLLSCLAGTGLGLALSAFVGKRETALALLPLVLIPQVLLGGAMVRMVHMSEAMKWLACAMPTRWGFEAALAVEFGEDHAVLGHFFQDPFWEPSGYMACLGAFAVGFVALALIGVMRRR